MGVEIVEGEVAVWGMNFGHLIVTKGDCNEAFPNYFGQELLLFSALTLSVGWQEGHPACNN